MNSPSRPLRRRHRYTRADLDVYLPHLYDPGEAPWKDDIREGMGMLSERDAWLLISAAGGWRRTSMAQWLDVSPATLRKMLSRARRRLLHKLNRYEHFVSVVEGGAHEAGA